VSEREGQIQRDRERNRQRDSQTERETDREREGVGERNRETERNRERGGEGGWPSERKRMRLRTSGSWGGVVVVERGRRGQETSDQRQGGKATTASIKNP
jgi:hypothetical protein